MIGKVIKTLEKNRQRKLSGDLIAIPWKSLPRLSQVLPGVQQGKYTILSAPPKGGKTQITDFLFLYEPFEWWLANRDRTDIKLKIFYFSLEMAKDLKIVSAISYKLFKDYGKIISPQNLLSVFEKYTLDKDILDIINSSTFQSWLKAFEDTVEIYDDIRNPVGMFKTVKAYAEARGKYEYKEIPWQEKDGSFTTKRVIDKYLPDDPNEYVIVITDHASLLSTEKGDSLHQAMGAFSSKYLLMMRDRWNYSPVLVQQQSANSSDAQYSVKGDIVVDKMKPSPEGLADNKYTGRDCNLMLSLFWPYKYNMPDYHGWDLTQIGHNHRELLINLNRDGISSASIDLCFLGACNYFKELPREPDQKVYNQIHKWNKMTI